MTEQEKFEEIVKSFPKVHIEDGWVYYDGDLIFRYLTFDLETNIILLAKTIKYYND